MSKEWSYMDDVKVKIHENYKPPPKISLVMTHNQTISLNTKIIDSLPKYNFNREQNVLTMAKDWQITRSNQQEERKQRLEKINEQIAEINTQTKENQEASCSYSPEVAFTSASNFSSILQPIPSQYVNSTDNVSIKSPFNFSEFETDTSSPFDNVALKSINDMEELAKVLKIDDYTASTVQNSYSSFSNNSAPTYSYTNVNGYYNDVTLQYPVTSYHSKNDVSIYSFPSRYDSRTFNDNKIDDKLSVRKKDGKSTDNTVSADLPNPYNELPKNLQDLSKSITSMGFPLDRVARTCKIYGDDNKKVVEHLLAMSQLLDLGFPENKVTEALLQFDNDSDKALDKLVS